jgi:hypothetical protein
MKSDGNAKAGRGGLTEPWPTRHATAAIACGVLRAIEGNAMEAALMAEALVCAAPTVPRI